VKILITGDAGFVGGYFRKALDGYDITGVDIKNGIDARKFFATECCISSKHKNVRSVLFKIVAILFSIYFEAAMDDF